MLPCPMLFGLTPCPIRTVFPPQNGQSWNDSKTKSVYIDPSLPSSVKADIQEFAQDFGQETGQSITVLPAGSADPGKTTQDVIRFINDPSGSPGSFAHTSTVNIYANGVNTNKQVSATVSINLGALIPGTSSPFYDPKQPDADGYIQGVTLHELGHAYGIDDVPVPVNSTTNQPDYSLQTPGASIMNGTLGTNDQGGLRPISLQCGDKSKISLSQGSTSGGTGGSGGGGGGGGGTGYIVCTTTTVTEWDDSINKLTEEDSTTCALY
jgi:hypothetical protein